MPADTIHELLDSTEALPDAGLLHERMERDGYLYFSRLFDPARAERVKRDIMRILREHWIIEDDDAPEPMWSGGPRPTEAEYLAVYDEIVALESFQTLARLPEVVAVAEVACDEVVRVWEQKLIRLVYPDAEAAVAQGVGAHQDGDPKLGYMAGHFVTCWIPVMDIELKLGGVAVAPGSHRLGLLDSAGTVASSTGDDKGVYGLDAEKHNWSTTNYAPGSVVFFASLTAHRGMPNHSDRIRLSCDFRYQGVSQTASWLAHTPGPEVRRTGQQIDQILASRALFVTTRAASQTLDKVRQRMLEERSTSLSRARELVEEVHGNPPPEQDGR
jgi:ectoine hydroxylase-related dioxygenase (phytanoyl-CoA dioxygenase family)